MMNLLDRYWRLFSALVLLAGAAWIFATVAPSEGSRLNPEIAPRQGFLAPDFQLQTLSGETLALSDLRGQPVLVNFWATWCPPCEAEMPAILEVYEEQPQGGLMVLGVASLAQDNRQAISAFVDEYQLTFPILLDPDDSVYRQYRVRSLPTSFFIDARGVVQDVVIGGPMAEALLRVRVEQLLSVEER